MAIHFSFPGLQYITSADFTFSRGVTPSVCTLRISPQDNIDLPPSTLRITDDTTTIEFPDCAIDKSSYRKDGNETNQRWSLQIRDRRWRWQYGTISGIYNKRLSNGLVDAASLKTTQQLIALCLDALGESGNYDISAVPLGVYPYVNWEAVNPALALQRVLDKIGCCLVLGLDNRVRCGPIGQGDGLPTGYRCHIPLALKPATRPSALQVFGGPIVYQTKLALAAIAREQNGQHYLLDDVDYEPATTWYEEHPAILYGVSDDDDRRAALESAFRSYRITGQSSGGMTPPGCTVGVTKVYQYQLLDVLVDSAPDLDGIYRTQLPYIEGDFWPYSDEPTDTDMERYVGPFTINKNESTVEFPFPVWSLTSYGVPQKPALYLSCAYGVRDSFGAFERFGAVRPLPNADGGRYLIRVPELFYSVLAAYGSDGISLAGTTDTSAQAISEATRYLDIFEQRFAEQLHGEAEYLGLLPIDLTGVRAQVRWSWGVKRAPKTQVGIMDEFDVFSKSAGERRRNEIVQESQT